MGVPEDAEYEDGPREIRGQQRKAKPSKTSGTASCAYQETHYGRRDVQKEKTRASRKTPNGGRKAKEKKHHTTKANGAQKDEEKQQQRETQENGSQAARKQKNQPHSERIVSPK